MIKAISAPAVKVADEVWVVLALLHRDNPDRADFTIDEIMDRARQAKITSDLRPGVYTGHLIPDGIGCSTKLNPVAGDCSVEATRTT